MPTTARPDFLAILRTLREHGVDFVVVGGVAAVLQGAPISTFDLDVVHSREEVNIRRLLTALESLEACFRLQPERRLRPDASHLSSPGHQLLLTRFGPLDLLGEIGRSRTYPELVKRAVEMQVGEGVSVRVLDLETLIAVKEEAAAEKDLAALPVLRRTLEERSRR
jgi:predicted nucleotidyltransferase